MITSEEILLISIIKKQSWLMKALKDVRKLKLPDWYIAAGAIRNTVWNYFHGYPTTSNHNDVDVVYFDAKDMKGTKEKIFEQKLRKVNPHLNWEIINQARTHLFECQLGKLRPAVKSSCESIAYWSETPTCIGIRLEDDNSLTICSPHGLYDLLHLIVHPIPLPNRNISLYKKRVSGKNWSTIWPKLKIEFL